MKVTNVHHWQQVQGLHAEYERLRLESDGVTKGSKSTGNSELAALRDLLQKAEKSKQDMEVGRMHLRICILLHLFAIFKL